MGPRINNNRTNDRVCTELRELRSGIADTSTLIYLERLGLLPLARQWFRLLLTPQVIAEFGHHPDGMALLETAPAATADEAVTDSALTLGLPLLSEDGRLLRRVRRQGHAHYNTLMLLLALYAQGAISHDQCLRLHRSLLAFARYGPAILACGNEILRMIHMGMDPPAPSARERDHWGLTLPGSTLGPVHQPPPDTGQYPHWTGGASRRQ